MQVRPFPYEIGGVCAELGTVIDMESWARLARVPDRRRPGAQLSGETMTRLLAVESKAWDPKRFADLEAVARVGRGALDSAQLAAGEVTAVVLVTCTPYQVMLDQDAFALLRMLGIADDVPPVQLGAGCAGLARAAAVVSATATQRALVIAYNVASRVSTAPDGSLLPHYADNAVHPYGRNLWASPALFSDGAGALVLRRREDAGGAVLYSRDSQSFGREPGLTDPLIHFPGGGSLHPAGSAGSCELSGYGMNAPEIQRYYSRGMTLNHQALEESRPGYLKEMGRLYTHQANPRLVDAFREEMGLSPEQAPSHVRTVGNTAAASTIALLHADLATNSVGASEEVCFSVVGSGPERGALITPVRVPAPRR
ncbi:3-oxoacyl-[acyl-carrier-protein] synthase III C-terminal domain-containing protein [Streptomyces sp. NPDC050535]|uniref:3-oxoacyl-[acyl-carrier-protein] synthase III C-terminal domain-containing protein n=1 Tax=Streptomyces sp. NPDC050535 TaxID=3365626 RepID=UPI0037B3BBFC